VVLLGSSAGLTQSNPALNRFGFLLHAIAAASPAFQVRRIYLPHVARATTCARSITVNERTPAAGVFRIIGPVSDHAIDGAGNFV